MRARGQFQALLLQDLQLSAQHQATFIVIVALLAQRLLLLLHLKGDSWNKRRRLEEGSTEKESLHTGILWLLNRLLDYLRRRSRPLLWRWLE